MKRPAHSTIAAYLALFLALGATAWAASTVGSGDVVNNSLKSVDLKNNGGVKTVDAANGTLGGPDVRNNSLGGGEFRANSIGGADADESTMSVTRILQNLGGAVNQQLTNSLSFKLVPNTAFTQAPTESSQILGTARGTFQPTCIQPRQMAVYLLLDDPVVSPTSIIGIAQVTDNGVGAVTREIAFGATPFQTTPMLFRTGAATPHNLFIHAGASCSSGSGATLDSVDLKVVGNR